MSIVNVPIAIVCIVLLENVLAMLVIVQDVAVVKSWGDRFTTIFFNSTFSMAIRTGDIWKEFNTEIYFFVLKKVKNKDSTNEIVQNSFVKIHNNIDTIREESKLRSWVFQIVRNEIANFFDQHKKELNFLQAYANSGPISPSSEFSGICCFDRLIDGLPEKYRLVMEKTYFEGKKAMEVSQEMEISLPNVKARIRRAKQMLKQAFNQCCKFDYDSNGKLKGESNCRVCKN